MNKWMGPSGMEWIPAWMAEGMDGNGAQGMDKPKWKQTGWKRFSKAHHPCAEAAAWSASAMVPVTGPLPLTTIRRSV